VPIDKDWIARGTFAPRDLPGTVGVYELGDAGGQVFYIGYAGGKSLLGIRGAIVGHCSEDEPNPVIRARLASIRYEVTTTYLTRHLELLSRFVSELGALPDANQISQNSLPPLARFR
jgi:hypothetical protein